MKRMKKIFALLLAFTMVLGMTMTASATEPKIAVPSDVDKATIAVTGLPKNANVKAYQIVDAVYDTIGFVRYEAVNNVVIADAKKPTAGEVAEIVNQITTGELSLTEQKILEEQSDGSYAAEAEAGYWLIIVDPIGYNIFNPMLAGVYYENVDGTGNTIAGGTVDSTQSWTLNGVTAHAKQSNTTIDKVIVDPSTGNEKGDDVAIGEDIQFKVTSKIPAYSKDTYKTATFTITDTLSPGISFLANPAITVKVAGEEVAAGTGTYTAEIKDQVLTVAFANDYIFKNGAKEVIITYMAELNEAAKLNNISNDNTVVLTYTTKPGTTTTADPVVTHHYSFDFDVVKKDDAGNKLPGATFTLYKEDGETVVATALSDANGILHYTGLDVGTYKLQETDAPDGYQIDATVHTVVITAEYDTNGVMTKYSIKVDDTAIENWNTGDASVTLVEVSYTNTKLINLPSTGGIGTTIFTVAGCGIMIAAAFFFFASRKKEN